MAAKKKTQLNTDTSELASRISGLPPELRRRFAESLSPEAYLSSLKVVHPVKGRVRWNLYPYQKKYLQLTEEPCLIVIKGREIGVSQIVTGEALYYAKYRPELRQVFISRNGQEARALIDYAKVLASEDPDLGDLEGAQEIKVPSFFPETLTPAVGQRGKRLYHKLIAESASMSAGRGGGKLTVILDELAHGNFKFWGNHIIQSVAPSVALGGRLRYVSTPQGRANAFYRVYREALAGLNKFKILKLPWYLCPVYNPKGYTIEDPERCKKVGETSEWYLAERPRYSDMEWGEEYDCDFTSSAGLIYTEFDEEIHVGDFAYNPKWPTYVGQDFGYMNPSVALLIQVSPSEDVFVIGESYRQQVQLGTLAKEVYRPMFYDPFHPGKWFCDGTDPNAVEDLKSAGLPAEPVTMDDPNIGINQIRKLMRPPLGGPTKFHIDRGCTQLITDLGTYAYKFGTDQPDKDVYDHGPDALRYFVVGNWRSEVITGRGFFTWGERVNNVPTSERAIVARV